MTFNNEQRLPTRRDVLQIAAKTAVAAGAGLQATMAEAQKPTSSTTGTSKDEDLSQSLVDAHVHVWTPDVARYPLAKGFTPKDMAPPSFTPEQLFGHARPCGVNRVNLIQMHFYGYDNSYMLDCIRRFPGIFAGTAVIDEHAPQVEQTMGELAKQGVRGFRIHPSKQDVEKWLFSPGMQRMWKYGAEHKLVMGALINPEALVAVDRMCQKMPQTPVVIDHFARIGMDGPIQGRDLDNLCRLARHKHTFVKTSAFYALGKKKPPYLDLAPMIRRLRDAFGPQRLMWASDCPFQVEQGHNYLDSVDLVRQRLDFLSNDDRQWMLRKTAQRVYFS